MQLRRSNIISRLILHNNSRREFTNRISFKDIIKTNKNDSKKLILVENLSAKNSSINGHSLRECFNVKIDNFWTWNYRRRNFALIQLNKIDDVMKIQSNCGYNLHALPIRTRMIETNFPAIDHHESSQSPYELGINVKKSLSCSDLKERFPTNEQLIIHLTEMNSLNELDELLRYFLITQLEDIICQSVFSDFNIYPFGSSLIGLGDSTSDLDLALLHVHQWRKNRDINFAMPELKSERDQTQQCLSLIADIIRNFMPNISKVNRILRARIPIVKMSFDLAPIDIDISIELSTETGHHGLLMADYLHYCVSQHVNIKQFLLFLKYWSKQHGVVKSIPGNWFSNFQILALAIYFLQKEQILKPIVNIDDNEQQQSITNVMNTMKMIYSFFEFLISFDFEKEAISIQTGKSFTKPDFSPLYIENPMEPTLNICKNVSGVEFKKLLLQAYNSLDAFHCKDFHLADLLDPEYFKTLEKRNNQSVR
uniref:Poly(A) RNA polymerase, mitochondrial-like n=1 Tax=Dermatophagoides pteronyssinus TaxID=6956 RepID=A0A6P6Y406_DERPT|nr:poly(A) RNA polymerase, mitochondrial-like [Dermatophagoides pteronyssinus]